MSMAVEQRPRSQLGGMGYDTMRYQQPHFTNPWASSQPQLFPQQLAPSPVGLEQHHHVSKGMPYSGSQQPAPILQPNDIMAQRGFGSQFPATAAPAPATYAPTSAPRYSPEYAQAYGYPEQDLSRRSSYQPTHTGRNSFSDALDASRGMVAMSQADITPRNIYGGGSSSRHGSADSYGFPSTTSSNSSISTGSSGYPSSYYPNSYSGSIDGSVTDYSSASEDIGHARTLPAPSQLINGFPPEPSSMMGQFNSKVSPSAQKKHKCKICDKRFTRPSSLQTHMYSHTGEKPFACDVEGCGRHFSVVSNLRRHRKVHKEENQSASPDDE